MTPARGAALEVMRAVRRGELADSALAAALGRLPQRDRPWVQELAYGTLRLRGRLDHLLGGLVHRGLGSLHPDILDILRLGAYQLLEMGSVPPYAAVSQAVEEARRSVGHGPAKLVNGVLQRLNRTVVPGARAGLGGEDRSDDVVYGEFPDPEAEPVEFLAAWGSHPRWLIERWINNFGLDEARALVAANNRRPNLYLRAVGITATEAADRLAAEGISTEPVPDAPSALRLLTPGALGVALHTAPVIVQDPAAGLVVDYAAVPEGARIVDLAAAPGGKAIGLAEGAGYLIAADIGIRRLERIRENLDRIGGLPVGLVAADARRPPFRPVDVVLADLPCTGTGTLRRHPDGRWRIGPADLESLVDLQREILKAAAEVVRPGGLLIYSTCSLEPEENEEQVDAFLDEHPEFSLEPPPAGMVAPELLDAEGRLAVRPQTTGLDGAFAARLRRRG